MRFDWKAVLGLAISAFLIWWIFRGEDLGAVVGAVARADLPLLLLAVAVATAGFVIRAMRWQILLHPLRRDTGLRNRFAAVSIGFMANNLLPARIGEFARAYALARVEPVSISGAFGTLVVERFLDGMVLLGLLGLALAWPGFPGMGEGVGRMGAMVEIAAWSVGAALVALVALLVWPRPAVRVVGRAAALLPGDLARPVIDTLESFLDGIQVLRSPRLLVLAVLWTVGFWTWHALSFWIGFAAFDIRVGFDAALLVMAVVGFAVAIPSAPGFFGTFHAGALWGLSIYGVAHAPTLAFAFGYHLGGFLPITLIGLWYAWRIGFSMQEMRESEERVEEAVEKVHVRSPRIAPDGEAGGEPGGKRGGGGPGPRREGP